MDDSVLHHEIDLSGHSDVVDGAPRHRDDVGEFIWVSAPRSAHPSSSAATLVADLSALTGLPGNTEPRECLGYRRLERLQRKVRGIHREVNVSVDETGTHGPIRKIDHPGTRAPGGRPTERSIAAIWLPLIRISAGPVRASEIPANTLPQTRTSALISEVPAIDINAALTAAHASAPSTPGGADPTLSSISTPVPTQGDAPNAC